MNKKLRNKNAQLSKELETLKKRTIELKQRSEIQDALNEMLNVSLMPISLTEQINKILLLVLYIPWLSLDKKGCVFLADDTESSLKMIAFHNLEASLLSRCAHINFGECLCGKAALEQKLIFRSCIDQDHDIRPEGMQPHGHYNVPIIFDGQTLGVLNLYVKEGHHQSQLEKGFLNTCSKTMANIIVRKKLEEKLHRLSYVDELTGLANRRQFMEKLDETLIDTKRKQRLFAILFMDLDYFKVVNDNLGHHYGDILIAQVASRMQSFLRDEDIVARFGGDEFVALLDRITSPQKAIDIAEKLIKYISMPYEIKQQQVSIGLSIGISLFPQQDIHADGLLTKADKALYKAKENRGVAVLYSQ